MQDAYKQAVISFRTILLNVCVYIRSLDYKITLPLNYWNKVKSSI